MIFCTLSSSSFVVESTDQLVGTTVLRCREQVRGNPNCLIFRRPRIDNHIPSPEVQHHQSFKYKYKIQEAITHSSLVYILENGRICNLYLWHLTLNQRREVENVERVYLLTMTSTASHVDSDTRKILRIGVVGLGVIAQVC